MIRKCLLGLTIAVLSLGAGHSRVAMAGQEAEAAAAARRGRPSAASVELRATTQGPFWPPSEIANADGDFILVGTALSEVAPGVIVPVPNSAVVVSKETVPPLDADGIETPLNWFGAPYRIVRELDLRPGSPDLDSVLYAHSFGPVVGPFGPAPRIPRAGESSFNLNGVGVVCPELFPAASQRETYTRPAYPLHRVPIWGFQGDGVEYDVETGEPFDPMNATGPGCPFTGCSGEDPILQRKGAPITLGRWLRAEGRMGAQLIHFNRERDGFTHARLDFRFRKLIPDSIYSVWAIRNRNAPSPTQAPRLVQPMAIPNVLRTDAQGDGRISFVVENPFPDPEQDAFGRRIVGVNIVFHSDGQNWGACFGRFGAGVDVHAHLSSFVEGSFDFTELVTVAP